MLKLSEIKQALRAKYAWPGGYPLFLVMRDGEAVSIEGARKNWREIARAHICAKQGYIDPQWQVATVEINWEDADLTCAATNEKIESAYGEESEQ